MPNTPRPRLAFVLLITGLFALILSACIAPQNAAAPSDPTTQLTLAGAPAPPAALLAHMADSETLTTLSDAVIFESIDDVRRLQQGIESGQIHAGMASTSALAVLRNQGVPIQLVDVFGWGLLHVLSGEKEIDSWENLRGSKIAMPYRGSVGDVIFTGLAAEAGMSIGDDLVMRYASNPLEAAEVLLGKQVQAAVLGEPWASVAIDRGIEEDEPIHRVMDVQSEWGAFFDTPPRIPQVGFFVTDALATEHPEIVTALRQALGEAAAWAEANPDDAAAVAAELTRLSQTVTADSLAHTQLNIISAQEARPELEQLFTRLAAANPDLIGGALPDDAFYGE